MQGEELNFTISVGMILLFTRGICQWQFIQMEVKAIFGHIILLESAALFGVLLVLLVFMVYSVKLALPVHLSQNIQMLIVDLVKICHL